MLPALLGHLPRTGREALVAVCYDPAPEQRMYCGTADPHSLTTAADPAPLYPRMVAPACYRGPRAQFPLAARDLLQQLPLRLRELHHLRRHHASSRSLRASFTPSSTLIAVRRETP